MTMRPSTGPRLRIGVAGPNQCSPEECELGLSVGAEIARRGAILVCGGMGGMMEAAAAGARREGGLTVGILPGEKAEEANSFIDLPLATGLGPFRNMLLVRVCDALIAIRGGYGTLTEIAFALRLKIPVVGLKTWNLSKDGLEDSGIQLAQDPVEAVTLALRLAARQCSPQRGIPTKK